MAKTIKAPKPDSGAAAQAVYEVAPPAGQPGRYAIPADLSAQSFSESRGAGDGAYTLPPGSSQKPATGKSSPTSKTTYDNAAGALPPKR